MYGKELKSLLKKAKNYTRKLVFELDKNSDVIENNILIYKIKNIEKYLEHINFYLNMQFKPSKYYNSYMYKKLIIKKI